MFCSMVKKAAKRRLEEMKAECNRVMYNETRNYTRKDIMHTFKRANRKIREETAPGCNLGSYKPLGVYHNSVSIVF